VAGGETVEEHMELVQRVFERLREVGLKCHLEKCCFAATEVEYLGMCLRQGVVSPQVAKVAATAVLPRPTDVTSVRAFSGVVKYYRQFIPDCSRLHAPLNALTKKGAPWEWGPAQERAFRALKEALQGEPVLVLPKRGRSIVWTYGIRVSFRGVKNQVFVSILDSKNGNTAKVRHASFKSDNICALKRLIETTNTKI
jgi:hypothetical protein